MASSDNKSNNNSTQAAAVSAAQSTHKAALKAATPAVEYNLTRPSKTSIEQDRATGDVTWNCHCEKHENARGFSTFDELAAHRGFDIITCPVPTCNTRLFKFDKASTINHIVDFHEDLATKFVGPLTQFLPTIVPESSSKQAVAKAEAEADKIAWKSRSQALFKLNIFFDFAGGSWTLDKPQKPVYKPDFKKVNHVSMSGPMPGKKFPPRPAPDSTVASAIPPIATLEVPSTVIVTESAPKPAYVAPIAKWANQMKPAIVPFDISKDVKWDGPVEPVAMAPVSKKNSRKSPKEETQPLTVAMKPKEKLEMEPATESTEPPKVSKKKSKKKIPQNVCSNSFAGLAVEGETAESVLEEDCSSKGTSCWDSYDAQWRSNYVYQLAAEAALKMDDVTSLFGEEVVTASILPTDDTTPFTEVSTTVPASKTSTKKPIVPFGVKGNIVLAPEKGIILEALCPLGPKCPDMDIPLSDRATKTHACPLNHHLSGFIAGGSPITWQYCCKDKFWGPKEEQSNCLNIWCKLDHKVKRAPFVARQVEYFAKSKAAVESLSKA